MKEMPGDRVWLKFLTIQTEGIIEGDEKVDENIFFSEFSPKEGKNQLRGKTDKNSVIF